MVGYQRFGGPCCLHLQGEKKTQVQVEVLWVVMPYSVVVRYQRFAGPCCLHLQGDKKTQIQVEALWVVMPCSVVVRYQRFGGLTGRDAV